MKLSIVATLYCSSKYVGEFCARAREAAKKYCGDDYEIILVNDGSPDDSLRRALVEREINSKIKIVDLSKNFGHYKAIMAGLAHARGHKVFLLDSDLEEEPEWLESFSRQMETERVDVVIGVQEKRKGSLSERFSGWIFYKLFRALTRLEIPESAVTARLMSKRYVDAVLMHPENEIFLAGIFMITGFSQKLQTINKHSTSETTYTLRKKLSVFINSVTSFSNVPLVAIFYCGITIFFGAMVYSIYLVLNRLFFSKLLEGWTSVVASVWLLGGLTISFLGIIGIYLAKIFSETKGRPNYIVKKVYEDAVKVQSC